MPEGDTIAYAARRMRPVLEGHVPDLIRTPHPRHAMDRWPERLAGRAVGEIRTHGKHLFIVFEGNLVIHSHLRMTGTWGVYAPGRRWGRSPRLAWLVLERGGTEVVQFNGPVLELLTDIGEALLDQRNVAGMGNIWKSEGCWEAALDPWRPVSTVSDEEAMAIIDAVRPRMAHSARHGRMAGEPRVFRRAGRPCPRCGAKVLARGQGDDNRTTFWCPGCQR
jgi:endonuclease-8